MNRKVVKVLKIFIVIFLIIALLFSIIVSQNQYHLDTCHEEHCIHCMIIHIARIIISFSNVFIIAVIFGVLIYFFLSRLKNYVSNFLHKSLVFQKVQLNE